MNKINYLTFSGFLMAFAGIMILLSESVGITTSKILVPLLFAISGILAYLFGDANPQHKIASQYHKLQGGGMVLFAALIAMIPTSLGEFIDYVVYFMVLFALIEIIFAFMAINSDQKLNLSILISRFLAGGLNLIGAILILATSATDEVQALSITGILILIGGIALVIFSFRIRKIDTAT